MESGGRERLAAYEEDGINPLVEEVNDVPGGRAGHPGAALPVESQWRLRDRRNRAGNRSDRDASDRDVDEPHVPLSERRDRLSRM